MASERLSCDLPNWQGAAKSLKHSCSMIGQHPSVDRAAIRLVYYSFVTATASKYCTLEAVL